MCRYPSAEGTVVEERRAGASVVDGEGTGVRRVHGRRDRGPRRGRRVAGVGPDRAARRAGLTEPPSPSATGRRSSVARLPAGPCPTPAAPPPQPLRLGVFSSSKHVQGGPFRSSLRPVARRDGSVALESPHRASTALDVLGET